ncbi:tRNA preQ1(34) S-adenosylmethionine ribosyltransferase-isomerase QueA [Flavobacteriales bacterium]|jgi:S-adenosylmethionine:tRNA ribosyltransferase-isomerase|nr:tRNA preQ1(34) S-adenosylmethionine ribosyltransferase-isomerase QueA [Flavobacteriales bacterium]MDO7741768.1 tRNA preQ1(34) S-adenosylmethionine ribosyltransferase-isomerase QueA [Flavobacteriales bacterium]
MKLTSFKYDIPEELIAQKPLDNRDDSRLMVVDRKSGTIEHKMFKDVLDEFDEGDVFVANDTRVFPAKLYGNKEKTGAVIEVFLLRELNRESILWDVLVDPARKIRIGNKLYFGENDELIAEVIDNTTSRGRTLRFLFDGSYEEFMDVIFQLGETPLPKYIAREVEADDRERFQTIYAKNLGAVAVPTAGLHFSKQLMKRLEIKGIDMTYLTLHIGLGTFRPVEVEDLTKHKVDSEQLIIPESCVDRVNRAKTEGKRIVSVGATAMRAMETSVSTTNTLKPYNGWTNKFIFPKYDFKISDALITNFHTPQSTLLMLSSAFAGHDLIMEAYALAQKEKYRFFAYGDALLIK